MGTGSCQAGLPLRPRLAITETGHEFSFTCTATAMGRVSPENERITNKELWDGVETNANNAAA